MNYLKKFLKRKLNRKVELAIQEANKSIQPISSPIFMGMWFYQVEKPQSKK